jgi:hypothetical protein
VIGNKDGIGTITQYSLGGLPSKAMTAHYKTPLSGEKLLTAGLGKKCRLLELHRQIPQHVVMIVSALVDK